MIVKRPFAIIVIGATLCANPVAFGCNFFSSTPTPLDKWEDSIEIDGRPTLITIRLVTSEHHNGDVQWRIKPVNMGKQSIPEHLSIEGFGWGEMGSFNIEFGLSSEVSQQISRRLTQRLTDANPQIHTWNVTHDDLNGNRIYTWRFLTSIVQTLGIRLNQIQATQLTQDIHEMNRVIDLSFRAPLPHLRAERNSLIGNPRSIRELEDIRSDIQNQLNAKLTEYFLLVADALKNAKLDSSQSIAGTVLRTWDLETGKGIRIDGAQITKFTLSINKMDAPTISATYVRSPVGLPPTVTFELPEGEMLSF